MSRMNVLQLAETRHAVSRTAAQKVDLRFTEDVGQWHELEVRVMVLAASQRDVCVQCHLI